MFRKLSLFLLFTISYISAIAQTFLIDSVYHAKTSSAMDQVYRRIDPAGFSVDDFRKLDEVRAYIASSYARNEMHEKVGSFLASIQDSLIKANAYFNVAKVYEHKKDNAMVLLYAKRATDLAQVSINRDTDGYESALHPRSIIAYATNLLVPYLSELGLYDDALYYLDRAIVATSDRNKSGLLQLQADVYTQMEQYRSALDLYAILYKEGNESSELRDKIYSVYYLAKPVNEVSFETYLDGIKASQQNELYDQLKDKVSRIDAPKFSLLDMDDRASVLDHLRGKIVVLDFWAMWCAPCKASFPAMQDVLNHYRDNQDVVFLFINTMEQADKQKIQSYLQENKYKFTVLLDTPVSRAQGYEVAKAYGVASIPQKIIIDKNGKIAIRLLGYTGDKEATVSELVNLIDFIRNQD